MARYTHNTDFACVHCGTTASIGATGRGRALGEHRPPGFVGAWFGVDVGADVDARRILALARCPACRRRGTDAWSSTWRASVRIFIQGAAMAAGIFAVVRIVGWRHGEPVGSKLNGFFDSYCLGMVGLSFCASLLSVALAVRGSHTRVEFSNVVTPPVPVHAGPYRSNT